MTYNIRILKSEDSDNNTVAIPHLRSICVDARGVPITKKIAHDAVHEGLTIVVTARELYQLRKVLIPLGIGIYATEESGEPIVNYGKIGSETITQLLLRTIDEGDAERAHKLLDAIFACNPVR